MQAINYWESRLPELKNLGHESPEELQRTEQWFKDRTGVFTGSKISSLMTCNQSFARKPWGTEGKIIAVGKGFLKYVFSKAMERKTDKYIQSADLFQFKYGKKVEQPILELFIEQKPNLIYSPCGLVKYNEYLGASPDGSFIDNETGEVIGDETKGAMNYETLYDRIGVPFDEKHTDFWQVQTEMLCLKVDKLFYKTGYPVQDAAKVVYGDMTNDEIKAEIGTVDYQLVYSSEIHQKAILDRAMLGNNIIEAYLGGIKFNDAVIKCCNEFEG